MRDKLIRLQKLYIDQFQRLRYLLKEEGRKYKHALLAEKDLELASIHRQMKTSLEDMIAYDKIKALNHYQKPQGLEAELHHNFLERRMKLNEQSGNAAASGSAPTPSTSSQFKPTLLQKCQFHITSTTKCGDVVIPLSKFCIKHILEDPTQILFRSCNFVVNASATEDMTKEGPCETPIADVLEGATCLYHTQFQAPFTTHEEKVLSYN